MKWNARSLTQKTVLILAVFAAAGVALFAQTSKSVKPLEFGVLDYSDDETWSFAKAGPPESRFTISAQARSDLKAKRGTRFYIPPDAFVYADGGKVEGQVEFQVKEVIDDLDFVTSGVPLTINENGNEVYFQSAGMFHVEANAGGEKLKLAPGKTIGVQFPDIVPGDEFFVYKMNEKGEWQRHGHNQELIAQSMGSGETYGVGVRQYRIDGLTWWNFDSPYPDVACLKGELKDPDQVFKAPYQVTSIGMNYKGAFSQWYEKEFSFKIMAHLGKRVKVLITDSEGNIGISGVISIGDRKGHFKYQEGEMVAEISRENYKPTGKKYKNYCYPIGTIEVKKLPDDILNNKDAYEDYLGLNREYYQVSYPPPPPEPGDREYYDETESGLSP